MAIDAHFSTVAGYAVGGVLSLPNALLVPLAGRRPTIDGQRLSPRLQLMADGAKRSLRALSDPPSRWQRTMAAVAMRGAALAHVSDARSRDLTFPGPAGRNVLARLYEPKAASDSGPLLVFVHGGGWQIGTVESYDGLCGFLARTAQLKILSLDYRLAPEQPFPAAFDDVLAGYRYAVDHASALGVARDRIAIAGDSAGGNLAAAVALHLGADATYRPKLAVLIYPVVDADLDRYESAFLFQVPLDRDIVHRDMRRYAPHDDDRCDPRFSVMAAPDLSDMPPTYVVTAGMDVLRDQAEALGERLRASGVEVTVQRFDSLPHGFASMLVDPDAKRATSDLAKATKKRI